MQFIVIHLPWLMKKAISNKNQKVDGPGYKSDQINPSNSFEINGESEDDGTPTDPAKQLLNAKHDGDQIENKMDGPIERGNINDNNLALPIPKDNYVTPKPPPRRNMPRQKQDDNEVELQDM